MRPSPRESAANAEPPVRGADEVLVIDPRGTRTAAQMVERKLLALLRAGNPGLYAQAAGGRSPIAVARSSRSARARNASSGSGDRRRRTSVFRLAIPCALRGRTLSSAAGAARGPTHPR